MAEEYDKLEKNLEQLKSLYEKGLITEEEYTNRKKSLLDVDFNIESTHITDETPKNEFEVAKSVNSQKNKRFGVKKIIWVIVICLIAGLAIFLVGKFGSAFSVFKNISPEKSVSSLLSAVKNADFISLTKQLNISQESISDFLNDELGEDNISAKSLLKIQKSLKKITGNMKYDLDTLSKTSDKSTVKAYISLPDYFSENTDEIGDATGDIILGAIFGTDEEEIVNIVCSCIDNITANKPTKNIKVTIDFVVEKINGKWTIAGVSDIDGGVLGTLWDLDDLFGDSTIGDESEQNTAQENYADGSVVYYGNADAFFSKSDKKKIKKAADNLIKTIDVSGKDFSIGIICPDSSINEIVQEEDSIDWGKCILLDMSEKEKMLTYLPVSLTSAFEFSPVEVSYLLDILYSDEEKIKENYVDYFAHVINCISNMVKGEEINFDVKISMDVEVCVGPGTSYDKKTLSSGTILNKIEDMNYETDQSGIDWVELSKDSWVTYEKFESLRVEGVIVFIFK